MMCRVGFRVGFEVQGWFRISGWSSENLKLRVRISGWEVQGGMFKVGSSGVQGLEGWEVQVRKFVK